MADKSKSLRDRIREASDITTELVDVPEWGCTIEMRSPTSNEACVLEEWSYGRSGPEEKKAAEGDETAKVDPKKFRGLAEQYVIICAHNPETGKMLFSGKDADWLGGKNSAVINRLYKVARRLTGLTEEEASDLGKGSEAEGGPSSGST